MKQTILMLRLNSYLYLLNIYFSIDKTFPISILYTKAALLPGNQIETDEDQMGRLSHMYKLSPSF